MKPLAGTSLLEQFSVCARSNPKQIAVQDDSRHLSYEELDTRSAHIAAHLRSLGLGEPTTPDHYNINHPKQAPVSPWILVHTRRTVDVVVGILSVLRAGGAYICVPSGSPDEYIRQIMDTAQVTAVLTDDPTAVDHGKVPVIHLWDKQLISTADPSLVRASMEFRPQPLSLATAIFTSGSTGRPKGAVLEHGAIGAMLSWQQSYMNIDPGEHTAAFAPFGFIASVWELLFPLAFGMTLHILGESLRRDILGMDAYFSRHLIRYVFLSPEMAELFSHNCQGETLKYVRVAGGPLRSCAKTSYEILYSLGMSENAGSVTFLSIQKAYAGDIPIGCAFGPTRIYLVDDQNQMVTPGETGKMAISSPSLARGYLGMPEKNADFFIPNSHKETPASMTCAKAFDTDNNRDENNYDRLFISEDLARVDKTGNLFHCGRKDFVIKIRGMRVDPGHTEAVMAGCQGVKECVVKGVADPDGNHFLLAWAAGHRLNPEKLSGQLAEKLPEYMVPRQILVMDELPRGVHGKIDRDQLSDIPENIPENVACNLNISKKLNKICQIFAQILNQVRIGPLDNFFAFGGDSLKLVRLQLRLRTEWSVDLTYGQLFRTPFPAGVLEMMETARQGDVSRIPTAPPQSRYPLTMPMRQMYLLWRLGTDRRQYEVDTCIMMEGDIKGERLEKALVSLVETYAILRSRFLEENGEPVWTIDDSVPFTLGHFKADDPEQARKLWERLNHERPPFDLTRSPLFFAARIDIGSNRCFLGFATHHILVDAAAIRFLMDGWWHFYSGIQTHDPKLDHPATMTDFALWDRDRQNSPTVNRSESFWQKTFETKVSPLDLPGTAPRPARLARGRESVYAALEKQDQPALVALAEKQNVSEFQILMAVWAAFLSRQAVFSKKFDEVVVGVPFVGRDHPDLQYCVGMFVRTLPLRFRPDPDGSQSFSDWLTHVRDTFLTAWEHQSCSFERIIQLVNPPRIPGRNPLYDVMINRLPQPRPFPVLMENGRQTTVRVVPGSAQGATLFDLILEIRKEKDRIILELKFARDLFQAEQMQTWVNALAQVVRIASSDPQAPLQDLPWPLGDPLQPSKGQTDRLEFSGKGLDMNDPGVTALVLAWKNILGEEPLGPEDDFFEHGGDSITAMRLEGELFKAGWYLPAAQIYETARLGDLAAMVEPAECFDDEENEEDEFA